ncbi:D-2-hydroxyacid dehydrogenase [Synoicihabitans lomoniglobus]|uniref:D-2-hydroxyacid dehydrogenase n=1 Tax=Synoicihabitans lomoniglobus TaxID=2909285 RepID=A0AAF0CMY4_9BACT|nr:D-2-hydroxyacid dehydrogenase [Opitutaceae bacterium LMO-M01]WED63710.1 D-2-hydroxyacid dehydrogenase [Opitutaceae bacterium LMO-M01]
MTPLNLLIDVPVEPAVLAALQKTGRYQIDVIDPPAEVSRPLPVDRIRETDVLFCSVPPQNNAAMAHLRWVQLASTGYTQLFGLNLPERGIRATNASGCFDVPIAEWAIAMMINLARDSRQMIRNQDAAVWDRSARFQREIRGLTVGLWGYGGIGRETARLAKQLGLRVHVQTRHGVHPRTDTYRVPGTGDPAGELPDRIFLAGEEASFLRDLDFLIVAMPLTHATEGLIGETELRMLPRHAFVLNPARGPIIQEQALVRALQEGWIAGAALDTHYHYPMPPEHPLWKLPNVLFTPHISGSSLSPNFKTRLWDIFAQNMSRFAAEEPLLNELGVAQLQGH